ncbi:unnamed protein product, partial [Durusdinium trenchii]
DAEVEEYRPHVQELLAITSDVDALQDHRALLANRWRQVEGFTQEGSPSKLSPTTRKTKSDFYTQKELGGGAIKSYQKKFKGLMQSVTNAAD